MVVNISLNPHGNIIDSRSVAYWAAAFTLSCGIITGFFPEYHIYTALYFILFPMATQLLMNKIGQFHTQIPIQLIDSINLGCLMYSLGYPITLSGVLIVFAISTSTFRFGLLGFFLVVFPIITVGAMLSYFFPMQLRLELPKDLHFIVVACMLLYMQYISYLFRKLYLDYIKISDQAKKQEERYAKLAENLAKYLSPQIWESIFNGKQGVRLESCRKRMTIFFSDLSGFTELSEELEPEALTDLLNNYLDTMSKVALKYGGTIDKFIGDSIMVFFGDPDTRGPQEDALAAVSMAIEMQKEMKLLRKQWESQGIKTPLEMRIGINTGYCTVGNFGTSSRMDYTLLGREVNLASRLETAAVPGQILISYECWSQVKQHVLCKAMGEIKVKGFFRKIPIYAVADLFCNLGQNQTYFEHEARGFSMNLDTTCLDDDEERKRVLKILNEATRQLESSERIAVS